LDAVDEAAIDRYERDGFLVVRSALTGAEVERALTDLKDMARAQDPACATVTYEASIRSLLEPPPSASNGSDGPADENENLAERIAKLSPATRAPLVRKFMGFTKQHPSLGAVSRHPGIRRAVEQICGETTRMFQSMALIKPPNGREKPWHQDHAYFDLPLDARIVGVWIALGHVTEENGAMFMLRGAHRDGPIVHFKRRDWQICDSEMEGRKPIALPMEAGDLVFFDAKIPHGTPTNRTNDQRWALQFHYVPRSVEKIAEEKRLEVFGSEGKGVEC
jgi:ectoine hydroxylase-related dioxygenase (phytanoyl-CoA dioxygenase family)